MDANNNNSNAKNARRDTYRLLVLGKRADMEEAHHVMVFVVEEIDGASFFGSRCETTLDAKHNWCGYVLRRMETIRSVTYLRETKYGSAS